jgi:hypothetical protein
MSAIMKEGVKRRLSDLFEGLWANRTGVNRSWCSGAFRYHPTYIHRGCYIIVGQTSFERLYVLDPPDAKVTPLGDHPSSHWNPFPDVDGDALNVTHDDGPWWDAVWRECDGMEAELEESNRKASEQQEVKRLDACKAREAKLAKATAAVEKAEGGKDE